MFILLFFNFFICLLVCLCLCLFIRPIHHGSIYQSIIHPPTHIPPPLPLTDPPIPASLHLPPQYPLSPPTCSHHPPAFAPPPPLLSRKQISLLSRKQISENNTQGHPIEAPPAYRPPPVAPGVAPTASAKYDKASNYNNSATNNNSNNNNGGGGYAAASYGDGSSLPQARAVPVYEGSPADDPYNARGALVSSAARPRAGAAGAGTTSSAPLAAVAVTSGGGGYPSATPTAPAPLYPSFGSPPVQQPYGGRQSQRHSTNYQGSYGVGNNNS